MTDERSTGEEPAPDSSGTQGDAPPPLAPLVNQGGETPADPGVDTTPQPTGTWQQAAPPPPIAPPVQQPAATWAPAPAPVAAATGQRTGLALGAGILMIIGGILFGLAGLGVAVLGRAVIESFGDLGQIPGLEGVDAGALASGIMTFVGILIMLYALLYLIGGIGIVRSREWGRVIGIIVGVLSGLLWLGSVATPDVDGARQSIAGSLVMLAIHAYILVVLIFFWRSRSSTA
jgi:hypothetical protein